METVKEFKIKPPGIAIKDRLTFDRQESGVVEAKVYFSDFQVYAFIASNLPEGLSKMGAVMRRLLNFPLAIYSRQQIQDNLIGREVWYREMPGIVRDFNGYTGKVRIVPENPERVFPPEPWTGETESVGNLGLWEDLLSEKIWWFREREEY